MRGRKPVPTQLKILRGNPGKRPLNDEEPVPSDQAPRCPEHLDEAAKAEWKRATSELRQMGTLARADRAIIAGYCQMFSRWAKAESMVQRSGEVLLNKQTGKLYTNPYVHVINSSLRQMHAFASELGLTPASRTRIKVERQAEPDSITAFARRREA